MHRTRPPKDYAKILNERNDTGWGAIEVQVSGDPLILKIADTALGQWCGRTKFPKGALVDQLKKKCGARLSTAILGSGSRLGGASQNVWVINAVGTLLEPMLEYAIHHKMLPP